MSDAPPSELSSHSSTEIPETIEQPTNDLSGTECAISQRIAVLFRILNSTLQLAYSDIPLNVPVSVLKSLLQSGASCRYEDIRLICLGRDLSDDTAEFASFIPSGALEKLAKEEKPSVTVHAIIRASGPVMSGPVTSGRVTSGPVTSGREITEETRPEAPTGDSNGMNDLIEYGMRQMLMHMLSETGGVANGGVANGGVANGGVANGGMAYGGMANGGMANGSGPPLAVPEGLTARLIPVRMTISLSDPNQPVSPSQAVPSAAPTAAATATPPNDLSDPSEDLEAERRLRERKRFRRARRVEDTSSEDSTSSIRSKLEDIRVAVTAGASDSGLLRHVLNLADFVNASDLHR